MKIAFVIYDGMTLLDFSGMYDPLTRLKTMGFADDFSYDVCAWTKTVRTFEGLDIKPEKTKNNLTGYDFICIPGGNGIAQLIRDAQFLEWISSAAKTSTLAAVCGGSLLLGAAGLLKGRRATTHPAMIEMLKKYTDNVSSDRIVEDGNIITARGVTTAIDLGLYLCVKIAGADVQAKIRAQMDLPGQ
jgi:transcriptional regulator GlxA family with amidase domain